MSKVHSRAPDRAISPPGGDSKQWKKHTADAHLGDASQRSMLAVALAHARRGFRVFPLYEPADGGCSCGNPTCSSIGKHPRLAEWQHKATTDPGQVKRWWKASPRANVGIATGRGLYVIDVDGEQGRRSLAELDLPATLTARTGRDGDSRHLYLVLPAGVELGNASGATIAPGIDGRGDGGYVVAPGSRHASGGQYAWTDDIEMAELPAALLDRLANRATGEAVELTADMLAGFKAAADALPAHERAELEHEARRRMDRHARDLEALPRDEGNGRGPRFYGAAWSLGECVGAGVLDLDHARELLDSAAAVVGKDASRDITRGLAAGAASPLVPELVDSGSTTSPQGCSDSGGAPYRDVDHHQTSDERTGGAPAGARDHQNTRNRYAGRRVDIAAELAKPPAPKPWRCKGIVMDGALTTVSGKGGVGKTWLEMGLADAVARGRTVAGIECKQGPAILIDGEMGTALMIDRIRGAGIAAGCVLYDAMGLDLSNEKDQEWLRDDVIAKHIDPAEGGFVGIDSLRRLTPSRRENDSDDMAPVVTFLSNLAKATGAGILLLHHEGWQAGRVRGSSAIFDQSDAVFSFGKLPADKDPTGELRRLTCRGEGGKMRMDREPDDVFLRIPDEGGIAPADQPEPKGQQYRRAILAALPQTTKAAAAKACGTDAGNKTWGSAWTKLEEDGLIVKDASKTWMKTGYDTTQDPAI